MVSIETLWHGWLRRPYRLAVKLDVGTGQSVVLLHGIGRSGNVWQLLKQFLSLEQYRLLAPDLLGFGASPKPSTARYDVRDHATAVLALLKRRHITTPIVLVGHSMGCLVAAHIASLRPDMVQRLILFEPPLFADVPTFRSHQKRRKLYFSLYQRIAGQPEMLAVYARLLGKTAAHLAKFATSETSWRPFERSLRNTIMQQTAYDELRTIATPTDIIHGRFDFVVTRTELKKMFASNPHITFHLMNSSHEISRAALQYIATLITSTPLKQEGKY